MKGIGLVKRVARRVVPRAAWEDLYRRRLHWRAGWTDILDRTRPAPDSETDPESPDRTGRTLPLPPAMLRYRVHNDFDRRSFLRQGAMCADSLREALRSIDRSWDEFNDVLDFGCGCARTILALRKNLAPGQRLHGTDVDQAAIDWCRKHLQTRDPERHRFHLNREFPPIPVPDASHDLLYAISVFTHLDEQHQAAWLPELARVLKPGGIALVTVHGPQCLEGVPPELGHHRALAETGFAFLRNWDGLKLHPDWYQSSFQTPEHVANTFGNHFRILRHVARGMAGFQDLVILLKP